MAVVSAPELEEPRDEGGSRGAQAYPTVELMGLSLAALSEEETIAHVLGQIEAGNGGWICTANVDILRQWTRSPQLRELVASASLVVADGMPLVWACALQRTPLPERVAGSTLALTLPAAAAAKGASVFLLGGRPSTAEIAALRLAELNPGLRVAGTLCPPLGFERQPETLELICATLEAASPDIVFVGLGFPKQEQLIEILRSVVPGAWFVGCGGSFSFIAGDLSRAPTLLQRLGLEWLHRLALEPRRLYRRYVVDGIPFTCSLMSRALVTRLRGSSRQPLAAAVPAVEQHAPNGLP